MTQDISIFIRDYVKHLHEGTAALFAGAGLSKGAGFVNWQELLKEIAEDLGLQIELESDLVSLAQYHVNESRNNSKITQKILEEFSHDIEETENHKIIARLPISTIWTTNYDKLLEKAIRSSDKVVDVKTSVDQLSNSKPRRDVVLYKMHGDVDHPAKAVLTKEDYETYYHTHEPFITALSGELITKTFLFIGFSFTDPNLAYVLGRLNHRFGKNTRQHYCFVKKHKLYDYQNPDSATYDYNVTKQRLVNNDLKRYGIKAIMIDEYSDITTILQKVEAQFKKKSVFISGSAQQYGQFDAVDGRGFIHKLSQSLIKEKFRIINGFGFGVGDSIINGALEAIYKDRRKFSEDQLIIRPFPQFPSGDIQLPALWEQYRKKMISLSGIVIFIFGSKLDAGSVVVADGVLREFEIAKEQGCILLPLGFTGYASEIIYQMIAESPNDYYTEPDIFLPFLRQLSHIDGVTQLDDKVDAVIKFLSQIK